MTKETPHNQQENNPNAETVQLKLWQKSWFKNVLWALAFLGVFVAVRPYMQGNVVHGQAPQMQVTSITGKTLDLQKINQQGKPVLVHIWATWCPICKLSRSGVEEIAKDYTVINIATQSADNEQLLAYAKENQMNPNFIVNDLEGQWLKVWGAKAVPADFVIDPQGNVAFVEVGFTTAWGLRLRLWWAGLTRPDKMQNAQNTNKDNGAAH